MSFQKKIEKFVQDVTRGELSMTPTEKTEQQLLEGYLAEGNTFCNPDATVKMAFLAGRRSRDQELAQLKEDLELSEKYGRTKEDVELIHKMGTEIERLQLEVTHHVAEHSYYKDQCERLKKQVEIAVKYFTVNRCVWHRSGGGDCDGRSEVCATLAKLKAAGEVGK